MRPDDTTAKPKRAPPRGRPALPPERKRSHVYEVAVNPGERAQVDEQAKRRGMAPSAYLRDCGLGAKLPRAVNADGFDATRLDAINKLWLAASTLRRELAPVANNCNQLARHANAGRYQEAATLLEAQRLASLVDRLRKIESEAARLLELAAADRPQASDR